jgi:hypothetical protein
MEAGINEHNPTSTTPVANLITIKPLTSQTFPSLKELDRKLGIFLDVDNDIIKPHVKPAPSFPAKSAINLLGSPFQHQQPPSLKQPPLSHILSKIIQSTNKLFFIVHTNPHSSYQEWKLVRIDFIKSTSSNPDAITNGKFLVKCLMQHPDDAQFSAPNQRF